MTISQHFAGTHNPSAGEGQTHLPLPLEIRRMIYRFAVSESRPLPLLCECYRDGSRDLKAYHVEQDWRMLETCKEFRAEMKELLSCRRMYEISR